MRGPIEGFLVPEGGVVVIADAFVGPADAQAVIDFADVETFIDLVAIGAFDVGLFPAGIVDLGRQLRGALQGVEGLVGLAELDERGGETILGLLGGGIGLEGDFEVVDACS